MVVNIRSLNLWTVARLGAVAFTLAVLSLLLAYPAAAQKGGGSKPAVPTNLAAVAGVGKVTLSWTASSGATSYNVKRSTVSRKNYVTVGSPASAGFLDTAVQGGTKYYYVVSAVNQYGESANSSEVSATPLRAASDPAIAFFVYGYAGGPHLAVMNADGQAQTELTSFGVDAPAFSPDGTQIAFKGAGPYGNGVYVMNRDGSGLRRVCATVYATGTVDWARMPDGIDRIAFEDHAAGGASNVYFTNLAGTEVIQLSHAVSGGVESPSFSGDGATLYTIEWTEDFNSWDQYIVAYRFVSVAGVLTLQSRTICFTTDSVVAYFVHIASARTQNKIAIERYDFTNHDLYLLDLDNPLALQQLTFTPGSEWGVTWSPDDSKLAFSALIGGHRTIATMPSTGGVFTDLSHNTTGYSHEAPYWRRTP